MTQETVFVKPAAGRQVRDPATKKHIPAEGIKVPRSSYWLRRLRDGDVLAADPAAEGERPTRINAKPR